MAEIDIPEYFICPISLQIMKDPVTAVTGITYDRESIEHWLLTADEAMCPVTKQRLPRDSDMTPNHTLRRLIQGWCTANANHGIDRIPTPKSPLSISHVLKLHRQLNISELSMSALKTLNSLAYENEKNRKCMSQAGTPKVLIHFIIKCCKSNRIKGLEEALRILHLTWDPSQENIHLVKDNFDLVESILWVLKHDQMEEIDLDNVKNFAIMVLKSIIEVVSSSTLEILNNDFFSVMVNVIRANTLEQGTKAALQVLIDVCPWGKNRVKIIETGIIFELVELELLGNSSKYITEQIFCLLAQLCSCADGRAELLKHAGGIAMIAKRLLRVSPGTDDRAVHLLAMVAKYSATKEVLMEMLMVGAVAKLCMVIQAASEDYLKKKANEILRLHHNVWNNSPCISIYLLTREVR